MTHQLSKQKSVEEEAKKSEVGKKALIKEERAERGAVRSRKMICACINLKSCMCVCAVL